MALNKDTFYKYYEYRAQSGYGGVLAIRFPSNTYYEMLIALEEVPDVIGENETFEFNLINSPVKGKVEGKQEIQDATSDFLYHRDNIYRLEKLKGIVVDMATITPDWTVRKFSGTVSYNENAMGADILKGTMKVTAMTAAASPMLNGRELDVRENLAFGTAIPESINAGDKLVLDVVQKDAVVTYKEFTISGENNVESEKTTLTKGSDGRYTLTKKGLVGIEASAEGYASWYTTVYVYDTTASISNFKL